MWLNSKQLRSDTPLEVCAADFGSVIAAIEGGASRVELCSSLDDGGLTPSYGFIKAAVATGIPVHVLIRPRPGDFVYDKHEMQIICRDIEMACTLGARGIVFGALTSDGDVDLEACRSIVEAAGTGVNLTFHRAFDMCRNPLSALESIIDLGFTHILTSGQAAKATEGEEMLRRIVKDCNGRIKVIAAAGINAANACIIADRTGVDEVHASARLALKSSMTYRNEASHMGKDSDEYTRLTTSTEEVRAIVKSLSNQI